MNRSLNVFTLFSVFSSFSFFFFANNLLSPTRASKKTGKSCAANIEFFSFVYFSFSLLITLIIIFNNLYVCMCECFVFQCIISSSFPQPGVLHFTTVLPFSVFHFHPQKFPQRSLSSLPKKTAIPALVNSWFASLLSLSILRLILLGCWPR